MSRVLIGIDTGTKTGLAIMECGKFTRIDTMPIHRAIEAVKSLLARGDAPFVHVVVEDARKAVHGRKTSLDRAKLKGAGSIMRDASIWEDFLTDMQSHYPQLSFEMKRPAKGLTKWPADLFAKATGWEGRTSEHARDAAMLIVVIAKKYNYERR